MNMNMNMLGKDMENERQIKEVPSFLKKIVSICFYTLLNEVFFFLKNLIQNTGIGRSHYTRS